MKLKLVNIEKIFLVLHLLVAIGLLIASFAGSISPEKNILFAFAGLAYPYLLIFNVIVLVWWLACRRLIFILATLAIIAIGWKPLTASFQINTNKDNGKKIDPQDIRMLTYNVHEFRKYGFNADLSTKEEIIDLIKKEKPDIICFQEFFSRSKGEFNYFKSIKKSIGLPFHYYIPYRINDYETSGHAIFSKYPIIKTGEIVFPNDIANKCIYADIAINNKTIRVYNVHFQSISFNKEDYDYIERIKSNIETEYKPTRRIIGMLKRAFLKRAVQTDLMKKELAKSPYPFIIAGDFNDTPASYTVTQITDGLKNTFKEKGSGFGKTYNGAFPNFQIDYIVASQQFDILNYQIIKKKLSDHFPVRSDIKLQLP